MNFRARINMSWTVLSCCAVRFTTVFSDAYKIINNSIKHTYKYKYKQHLYMHGDCIFAFIARTINAGGSRHQHRAEGTSQHSTEEEEEGASTTDNGRCGSSFNWVSLKIMKLFSLCVFALMNRTELESDQITLLPIRSLGISSFPVSLHPRRPSALLIVMAT